jgi:tetratricopeptide (TPR) repeat protein
VTRPTSRALLIIAALAGALLEPGVSAAQTERAALRQQLQEIMVLERSGQFERAKLELEAMLQDHPAEPGALLAYERVCRRLGTLGDALAALQRAVELDIGNVVLWQAQFRVLGELGRSEELFVAGERWLSHAPRSETAYREYALALSRLGEFQRAERVLLEGQRVVERREVLTVALADLYARQGQWREAALQWSQIMESSPNMGWDLVLARFEALGREYRAVAAEVLAALGDPPASPGAVRLGAVAALFADQPAVARQMAETAADQMDPLQRRIFLEKFAGAAARYGQPATVAWAYRRMVSDMHPDSAAWTLARQIVQYDLSAGDTAAALGTLDRFLAAAEPGTATHRQVAGLRLRLIAARGPADDAAEALQRYVEVYPDDRESPDLALIVAEAYLRAGQPDESRDALERVSGSGGDREVMAQLSALRGYLALYAGEFDEARANFELAAHTLSGAERGAAIRLLRLLRSASEAELRAVSAAQLALLQQEPQRAYQRLVEGLEKARPSAARPSLLVWAGELAIEAGLLDSAESVLRGVPENYPESGEAPLALMTLADALSAAGRLDDAIATFETLIIDYPDSALTPIARRRLAELSEEIPRS